MKLLIKAAVIAAALGASAAASASTFDFSYTFTDGQQITGSLDGTLTGTNITNISDLQVSLNGIAFSGGSDANGPTTLAIYGFDATNGFGSGPVTFSTVASQNNFEIADENPAGANGANYFFSFANDPSFGTLHRRRQLPRERPLQRPRCPAVRWRLHRQRPRHLERDSVPGSPACRSAAAALGPEPVRHRPPPPLHLIA